MAIGICVTALIGCYTPVDGDTERTLSNVPIDKLITPSPKPDYEAEVLVPLREAQAEKAEADRAAREKAEAVRAQNARVQAAKVEQERLLEANSVVQASQALPVQVAQPSAGSHSDWMAAAGIAPSDYGYVDYIISRESGWRPTAINASSGAEGLPQALPYSKTGCAHGDAVCQLRWANSYATSRYGSWANSYHFWVSNSWW